MRNVLSFVADYCWYNKRVIRTISYNRIRQRLAFWILTSQNGEGTYKLLGTQEVLADILHTNRSSLNQELQKLRDEGLISFNRKCIKILDPEGLKAIVEDAMTSLF